jgi:hypothetical protein
LSLKYLRVVFKIRLKGTILRFEFECRSRSTKFRFRSFIEEGVYNFDSKIESYECATSLLSVLLYCE